MLNSEQRQPAPDTEHYASPDELIHFFENRAANLLTEAKILETENHSIEGKMCAQALRAAAGDCYFKAGNLYLALPNPAQNAPNAFHKAIEADPTNVEYHRIFIGSFFAH